MASSGQDGEMPVPPIEILGKDAPAPTKESEPELPKLSMEDFRVYNRLAVMMEAYVSYREHSLGCFATSDYIVARHLRTSLLICHLLC